MSEYIGKHKRQSLKYCKECTIGHTPAMRSEECSSKVIASSSDFFLMCRYRGNNISWPLPGCCTHGRSHTRSPGMSIMTVGDLPLSAIPLSAASMSSCSCQPSFLQKTVQILSAKSCKELIGPGGDNVVHLDIADLSNQCPVFPLHMWRIGFVIGQVSLARSIALLTQVKNKNR